MLSPGAWTFSKLIMVMDWIISLTKMWKPWPSALVNINLFKHRISEDDQVKMKVIVVGPNSIWDRRNDVILKLRNVWSYQKIGYSHGTDILLQLSEGTNPNDTLISDIQLPEQWDNKFLLLKSLCGTVLWQSQEFLFCIGHYVVSNENSDIKFKVWD